MKRKLSTNKHFCLNVIHNVQNSLTHSLTHSLIKSKFILLYICDMLSFYQKKKERQSLFSQKVAAIMLRRNDDSLLPAYHQIQKTHTIYIYLLISKLVITFSCDFSLLIDIFISSSNLRFHRIAARWPTLPSIHSQTSHW